MGDPQFPDAEDHSLARIDQEEDMAITANVGRSEGILRAVGGGILIVLGFFLPGFWKPLSIVVGALLVLTAVVGY